MSTELESRELNAPSPPLAPDDAAPTLRIAIADDDPESLALMGAILRQPTTEIHTAENGAELVVLLSTKGPFDLVVTDVDMPWAEGLAVIRSARVSHVKMPVLFVSGLARPDLTETIADLGNARLLAKPISVAALRQAVADLLEGAW
jgi:CheY-like chemotaxis protein